jgi:hypothetical protein
MSYLKPSICAALLVMSISSMTLAGNITPRSGNITPSRSGNITPSRSGNITPSRSGNITPTRSGIVSVDSLDRGQFGFTFLFQLLLESGLLF